MSKVAARAGLVGLFFLMLAGTGTAVDPPHDSSYDVSCTSCHTAYSSGYPSMTKDTNANLCISCHSSGNLAASLPLATGNQAVHGGSPSGNSHRWDVSLPATDDPNNPYGLRSRASLASLAMGYQLDKYGNQIVCSVCHDQHTQDLAPWDLTAEGGTASGGSTTTVVDSSKSWTANQWASCSNAVDTTKTNCQNHGGTWKPKYVKMKSGSNNNKIKLIVSNTSNTLTVSPAFTYAVAAGNTYIIANGRHFQRVVNDYNSMCEDCHYYRSAAAKTGGVYQTDVRTWDGKKKSHPVNSASGQYRIFTSANGETPTVADPSQFNAAPLEPEAAKDGNGNWTQQASNRYKGNSGFDSNATNNYILDGHNEIRCLTCHGVHYTDSDSATTDSP